jgi:hypothetical protein
MRKRHGACLQYRRLRLDSFPSLCSRMVLAFPKKDYDYLRSTQNLQRYDASILDLTPKERTRVHALINDPQTANDPAARDKIVKHELGIFLEHQLWEKQHPGELWDVPRK